VPSFGVITSKITKFYFTFGGEQMPILFTLLFILNTQKSFAGYETVEDKKVLVQISKQAIQSKLANRINLLVWNTHKGEDDGFEQDLSFMSKKADLVLLQESMNNNFMNALLVDLNNFDFLMAQSWRYSEPPYESTGVSTGSRSRAEAFHWWRSPRNEPIINTPKMILATTHRLENDSLLLVINIHGINFVPARDLARQLRQLTSTVKDHRGPIIFAGDFNTWSSAKIKLLNRIAREWGFKQAALENDDRWIKFDHLLVKGCEISGARLETWSNSSDHYPITAELVCL
jgi:endonuclease/exonuclease/phosphatase (EEP) superfamily protein YafD